MPNGQEIIDPLSLNLYTYTHNNPIMYVDQNGHWIHIAAGALIGGIIGYASNLIGQLTSNGLDFSAIDNRSLWAATGAGAMTGGLAAATGGASTLAMAGAQGALLGGIGYGSYNLLNGTNATFAGYAASMGFGAVTSGAMHYAAHSGAYGNFKGSWGELTKAEQTVVSDLLASGNDVAMIPRDTASKTPDFLLNGVRTELKTLTNPNINTAITRIQQGFKQGASQIIIDARGTGLTQAQVESILARAAGTYSDKQLPGSVDIWI